MKEQAKLSYDDIGCIQLLSNDALIKIAIGKVNMTKIAKEIMAGRGYDPNNKWVGFDNAETIWDF